MAFLPWHERSLESLYVGGERRGEEAASDHLKEGPPLHHHPWSPDEGLCCLMPVRITEASEASLAVPSLMQGSDEDREI
jgi:hypothetical protein